MSYSVGVFVGSLAQDSINRKLAKALFKLAPDGMDLVDIPIGNLPLYNRDFDADFPPEGRAFKEAVAAVDALLFVTPEYNRSVPGVLKNAIDWGSRPWGSNSFAKKPSAVTGTSPGHISTAVAQQHLRSILSFVNSPELANPECYIHFTEGLIDDDGNVTVASTEEFLRGWLNEFHLFIAKVVGAQQITL
ncbi:NAD(P)H-dependent FMN reductase [Arthrobacter alpinus]|uniref:NAD(P)H-dependent FMN reductase n=1 Tax=Arthrobacter alpinus TaxID=656366 RepID=A0A0U3R5Z2_9MICC|nr:NADPH-dependent FMN reductase [Arthrobacter alpinus]ALV47445.1 ACP phosphodiesterase [Arthrobacter alpinus]SEE43501.1 NAD(P)H-dependent FMN reductase [Arthrobacter alpinus]